MHTHVSEGVLFVKRQIGWMDYYFWKTKFSGPNEGFHPAVNKSFTCIMNKKFKKITLWQKLIRIKMDIIQS